MSEKIDGVDTDRLHEDIGINPQALDVEAVKQGEVFLHWSEESVKARAAVDRKKQVMDLTEASLQLDVRNEPEKHGLKKATEASVEAVVKAHEKYQTAYGEWVDARENSAALDKVVDALEQKKRMIECLITLHGQQYFAGPSVPRDLVSAWEEQQGKTKGRVNESQKERARKRK